MVVVTTTVRLTVRLRASPFITITPDVVDFVMFVDGRCEALGWVGLVVVRSVHCEQRAQEQRAGVLLLVTLFAFSP